MRQLLQGDFFFDRTERLPVWRGQSASRWLGCLLGKDSRLYSYLKKRLDNPTTIQSTTSAPRAASTLLHHQRSTKVTFLQWYKEEETEKVIFIDCSLKIPAVETPDKTSHRLISATDYYFFWLFVFLWTACWKILRLVAETVGTF